MRTTMVLVSLVLALSVSAAPSPALTGSRESGSCPSNDKTLLTSSKDINYQVLCQRDLDTQVISITNTNAGIQGCLTVCDNTVDCTAVTFVASNQEQTSGTCYIRSTGESHEAGKDTAVALRSSPEASPTTSPSSPATPSIIFAGVSLRSASKVHFGVINANSTNFYIGRGTSTFCPSTISPCPAQSNTIFKTNNDTLSLNVVAPGGQQVYVDATGALRFTMPHSGNAGEGSETTGFRVVDDGLRLQFGEDGFLACPVDAVSWQVYAEAKVAGFDISECLGFSFRVSERTTAVVAAWEYI